MLRLPTISALALLAFTAPAFAHADPALHGSFMAGFSHPLFGLDHILAMMAVGLWASLIGGRALLVIPSTFVGAMIFGFALALAGAPLPMVEPMILASVVALGLLVAVALPVQVWAGAAAVGGFALFHGFAHGGEAGAAALAEFGAGFAVSTALLHATGIALGLGIGGLFGDHARRMVTRSLGALVTLGGVILAFAS